MSPTLPLPPFAILSLAINHAFASPLPQNGDGGGSSATPDGGLGYDPSASGDANPGSAGTDTGGVGLSKGAIIAIAVVAGLVSIFGGSSTLPSPLPFIIPIPKTNTYPNSHRRRPLLGRQETPMGRRRDDAPLHAPCHNRPESPHAPDAAQDDLLADREETRWQLR